MTKTIANPKLVKSPLARISYPNVFKMQKFDDGKEQYNVVLLIPKTEGVAKPNKDPILKPMYAALKAAAVEKWGGSFPDGLQFPVKDGDKPRKSQDEASPECRGMWVVPCSSGHKPGIVGPDAQSYLENESDFYAGCYAFVSMNGYAWSHAMSGNGVGFGLRNIQKVKDGEKLGGIVAAHDDFEPIQGSEQLELEGDEGEDDGF